MLFSATLLGRKQEDFNDISLVAMDSLERLPEYMNGFAACAGYG